MKKKVLILLVLAMTIFSSVEAASAYLLRPGDVLSINAPGFAELTFPEIVVRPDGKFSYPFIGDISVAGLSASELTQQMTESLQQYYVNPRITINVTKFGTTRVYVLGEVNRPGLYDIEKSHNLLDAIGAANGWTKDAAKTKVFIIRKDSKSEPLRVNLMELLKKGDVSKNYALGEGDVVYLTGNGRIDIARDITPLLAAQWYIRHWNDRNI